MKIKIVEKISRVHETIEEGIASRVVVDECTGRSWEIDIPIEPADFKKTWLGIKGDLYGLIQHLRGAIR